MIGLGAGSAPQLKTTIEELLVSLSVIIILQKFFYGNSPLGFLRG